MSPIWFLHRGTARRLCVMPLSTAPIGCGSQAVGTVGVLLGSRTACGAPWLHLCMVAGGGICRLLPRSCAVRRLAGSLPAPLCGIANQTVNGLVSDADRSCQDPFLTGCSGRKPDIWSPYA
ncbi:hypothetical protein UY3_01304 [Chelonia mydas]|uniref:Uncharacterized protein n=1 Tax=Chelonia mydas TaxID=8469 RepID=M7C9W9_CHEMY|nr:hypothetical protein UY3_01304 [Chelonia mydas]